MVGRSRERKEQQELERRDEERHEGDCLQMLDRRDELGGRMGGRSVETSVKTCSEVGVRGTWTTGGSPASR